MTDQTEPDPAEPLVVDAAERPPAAAPRVLVTNDDGVDSPGLHRLAIALAESFETVVAAPDQDRSGSGTGIGRFDALEGVGLQRAKVEGVAAYTVAGPPGLAVMAAALGAFGEPPDLVVSGVNAGINTGHSIIHSGTVGAVLTARTFGMRGLAVSLDPSDPMHWETAVDAATDVAAWMINQAETKMVLNLNVPASEEPRGFRWADLDEFGYFRVATADMDAERLVFEVTTPDSGLDPASDTALCREGYLTLTPLSTVEPTPFPPTPAGEISRT